MHTLANTSLFFISSTVEVMRLIVTWWDCVKNDMESLGLPKRMRSPGINGEGELRGQLANPGSPGKMTVKTECVCVLLCTSGITREVMDGLEWTNT